MAQSMPKTVTDNLVRLSAKPGVQYTLILSRKDGAIVQSTGLPTSEETQGQPLFEQKDASQSFSQSTSAPPNFDRPGSSPKDAGADEQQASGRAKARTAENVARLVFAFVTASGELAEALDGSNEVQLLRLRTAKGEVMIVPDSRFLLVVVHDPPKVG